MEENKKLNCYSINIEYYFENMFEIEKARKSIYSMIKRLIELNLKFNELSFIIGISNRDKNMSVIRYIHTGKRGRPKKVIDGVDVKLHLHTYIIGEKYISEFCQIVCDKLSKKKHYKAFKSPNDNTENAVNYVTGQCISHWVGGDYFKSKNNK